MPDVDLCVWISVSHAMGCCSPSSKKEKLGFVFNRSLWDYSNAKQTHWVGFSAVSTISLTKCLLEGKARTVSIMTSHIIVHGHKLVLSTNAKRFS